MRKMIWIVLLLIALLWIAIATYWTGTKEIEKKYDFPEATPTLTPYPTDIPQATFSATVSPEASPTSLIKIVSPTVKSNLNY